MIVRDRVINLLCFRDAISRTTEVVNALGEASAKAQGLSKPITTAERLRNSEHQKVYLLVDREAKKYVAFL